MEKTFTKKIMMYFAMASSLGMAAILHASEKEKNAVFSDSEATDDEREPSISIKVGDKKYFPFIIDNSNTKQAHGYFVDPTTLDDKSKTIDDPLLSVAINDANFRKLFTSKSTKKGEVPVYCLIKKGKNGGKMTCDCDPTSMHAIEMERSAHRPLPKT